MILMQPPADGSGDTPPAGVTEVSRVTNADGTVTITYR
jgi:hypothetical protein